MVYTYGADVLQLPDPKECPEIMKGLSDERKNKIMKYTQSKSRKESLGAGLLLKYVFGIHGIPEPQISYGENEKPLAEGICFNLSHSHGKVICAISKLPVGCDLEKIEKAPVTVADRFFCADESTYLNTFTGSEKEKEFYRLWTMKESYMKLTGEGMQLKLDQFEVVLGDEVKIKRDGEIVQCTIKEYDVPGYKVTICARETEFAEYMDVTKYLI